MYPDDSCRNWPWQNSPFQNKLQITWTPVLPSITGYNKLIRPVLFLFHQINLKSFAFYRQQSWAQGSWIWSPQSTALLWWKGIWEVFLIWIARLELMYLVKWSYFKRLNSGTKCGHLVLRLSGPKGNKSQTYSLSLLLLWFKCPSSDLSTSLHLKLYSYLVQRLKVHKLV